MIGLLGPYRYLVLAGLLLAALAGAYVKGRGDGRAVEASDWTKREAQAELKRSLEREALQRAIEVRDAEIHKREQAAADAVQQVRVEYLPAKTVVKREVVERPVFRDCRIGDGMRDTINAALRRTSAPGPPAGGGADGLPAGAPGAGG